MKRAPRSLERRASALAATATLATIATAACVSADSYVYTAQRFDPAGACLEPYRAVEVVEGPGVAATCEASCLTVGGDVFVTTMCPPLPTVATELASDDAACMAALAALKTTCGEEPGDSADSGAGADGSATADGSALPDLDASGDGDGA